MVEMVKSNIHGSVNKHITVLDEKLSEIKMFFSESV